MREYGILWRDVTDVVELIKEGLVTHAVDHLSKLSSAT